MSRKLRRSLTDYNLTLVKEGEVLLGNLGTRIGGKTVVGVPGRASYVYVRLRTKQSELIEAFNDKVAQKFGVPVKVKRQGNRYIVSERNTETFSDWETADPYIPQHAVQHIFDKDGGNIGGDPVWVYPYQFMPSLVVPFGSRGATNVFIHSYPLHTEQGWKYSGNTGTPRLTTYNPTSGATLVLVTLDSQTGNPAIFATTGTFIPESVTGTGQLISYLPQASTLRYIPDSFVRLVSGTTAIGWNNIHDVRQFLSYSPSGTSYLTVNGYHQINDLEFSGATLAVSGTSAFLQFTPGGGAGSSVTDSTLFYSEGRLATGSNVSNEYMITQPTTINQIGLYVNYLGVSGSTTIDVNLIRSGTSQTIFATQANRPTLQYNAANKWVLAVPDIKSFGLGDVLSLDIDSVSRLSDTLVVSKLVTGSSGGGGSSLTVEESDGSPSVTKVTKIKFSGLSVTNDGGGTVTVTKSDSPLPSITFLPFGYTSKNGTFARLLSYLYQNTSNADGDYLEFETYLAAGTYTFVVTYSQGQAVSSGGKLDVTLDGSNVATGIDCYGTSEDLQSVTTGVVVATSGFGKLIRIKVNGRNVSSSAYYSYWSSLKIVQTA
jgi:hypothetical protein